MVWISMAWPILEGICIHVFRTFDSYVKWSLQSKIWFELAVKLFFLKWSLWTAPDFIQMCNSSWIINCCRNFHWFNWTDLKQLVALNERNAYIYHQTIFFIFQIIISMFKRTCRLEYFKNLFLFLFPPSAKFNWKLFGFFSWHKTSQLINAQMIVICYHMIVY